MIENTQNQNTEQGRIAVGVPPKVVHPALPQGQAQGESVPRRGADGVVRVNGVAQQPVNQPTYANTESGQPAHQNGYVNVNTQQAQVQPQQAQVPQQFVDNAFDCNIEHIGARDVKLPSFKKIEFGMQNEGCMHIPDYTPTLFTSAKFKVQDVKSQYMVSDGALNVVDMIESNDPNLSKKIEASGFRYTYIPDPSLTVKFMYVYIGQTILPTNEALLCLWYLKGSELGLARVVNTHLKKRTTQVFRLGTELVKTAKHSWYVFTAEPSGLTAEESEILSQL